MFWNQASHIIICNCLYLEYTECLINALCVGLMELPVSQLMQPPRESRLLREADPTFVTSLKLKMLQDPSAPGATPMAVLCKDMEEITEFNVKHKNVYRYEVLGGLHTLVAKNQLMGEYPDNPFFKVMTAEVYVGLSDEEALRLAQRHNINSHFIHKVTHRDLVGCSYYIYMQWPFSCKRIHMHLYNINR